MTTSPAKLASPPSNRSVGIERIDLPDYLTRPELVRRTAANELKIADYERWGEPLKEGFRRTLRQDLVLLIGTDHVYDSPFEASQVDLILDVEVLRFERVGDHSAELEARYSLRDRPSGKTVVSRETRKRQQLSARDTQATVAALSQLLGAFAEEVAEGVRGAPMANQPISERRNPPNGRR